MKLARNYNMARDTYAFSNGVYNDWHRKYEGIAMIDIDSVEVCKYCYEPLAIKTSGNGIGSPRTAR